MAYLDLDNTFAPSHATRNPAVVSVTAEQASFSALEWSVIAIAERDTLASLNTPGRMSRALGGLFGRGTSSKLADPKLEALRRAAVYARHRGAALPISEINHFHSAGFSEEQMEMLVMSITGLRDGASNRRLSA